ncbi:hypothetical protein LCGC14_2254070 [marine sediment metagenome]|uniref:Uncharacterized protein n=1 Tax=marine sediment metagenome TaxID=412755 RepID=A0A0F9FWM8_9ZZZZ
MVVKIRWVKPEDRKDIDPGTAGFLEEEFVVLVKGRADEVTEAHERAHVGLGHQERGRVTARRYVEDEVDADLVTYAQMDRPRNIIKDLRGIVGTLVEEWGGSPAGAVRIIEEVFKKKGNRIPLRWRSDLKRLKMGIRRREEPRFL